MPSQQGAAPRHDRADDGYRDGRAVRYPSDVPAAGRERKADGQAKMMLGTAGVIRLVPDEEVTTGLGLAEGIETALSHLTNAGVERKGTGFCKKRPCYPGGKDQLSRSETLVYSGTASLAGRSRSNHTGTMK